MDLALEYSKSYTRRVRVRGASCDKKFFPVFHSKDNEETSSYCLTMALHTINEGMYVKVAPYKGSSGGVGVVKKKKRWLRTPEEFAAVFAAIHATTNATGGGASPPSPGYRFDIRV
jgi:hypothetical protein